MSNYAYYSTLNVLRTATVEEIKKAYKKAILITHPDKGGSDELFNKVQEAYNTLSDNDKRNKYNYELKKLNKDDGLTVKPSIEREDKKHNTVFKEEEKKRAGVVEIPSNPSSMGVKDLKSLLTDLGLDHSDCVEKEDLLKRLQDYKSKKSKPAERTEKPEKMESKNVSIKIISAGNQETGKSCIIKRYCEGRFVKRYIPTIGVDYGVKKIEHKGYNVAVNFFDLSGAEEFKEIRTDFYKDAQAILLVYDISDKESFKNLHFWEDEIKSKGLDTQKIKTVLIGNKSDAGSREIQTSEGSKWAKSRGFNFYEVSCSTGQNISDAFTNVLDELMNQHIASKKLLG